MNFLKYAFALPKCSLYRRFMLFIMRTQITASLLCAFVFWVMVGIIAAAMLFLVGSVILKSILR